MKSLEGTIIREGYGQLFLLWQPGHLSLEQGYGCLQPAVFMHILSLNITAFVHGLQDTQNTTSKIFHNEKYERTMKEGCSPWDHTIREVEAFLQGMDVKDHDLRRAPGSQGDAGQQGGQGLIKVAHRHVTQAMSMMHFNSEYFSSFSN